MKLIETYGVHPSAELEVLVEGDHFRIRVREPHGKASFFIKADELERFGLACMEMAINTHLEAPSEPPEKELMRLRMQYEYMMIRNVSGLSPQEIHELRREAEMISRRIRVLEQR